MVSIQGSTWAPLSLASSTCWTGLSRATSTSMSPPVFGSATTRPPGSQVAISSSRTYARGWESPSSTTPTNCGVMLTGAPPTRISAGTLYRSKPFAASLLTTIRGAIAGSEVNSSHCPVCGRSGRNGRMSAVMAVSRTSTACPGGRMSPGSHSAW
jgi:hypothetical protein